MVEAGLLKLVQRTGGSRLSLRGHTHTDETVAAGIILFACVPNFRFAAFVQDVPVLRRFLVPPGSEEREVERLGTWRLGKCF